MAEAQAAHRISMDRTVVGGDSKRSYLGLAAAFILSMMIVIGGIYVMVNVHPWAGASVIGTQVAGLAGAFVYGTTSRRSERGRKAEQMMTLRVDDDSGVSDISQAPIPLDREEQD